MGNLNIRLVLSSLMFVGNSPSGISNFLFNINGVFMRKKSRPIHWLNIQKCISWTVPSLTALQAPEQSSALGSISTQPLTEKKMETSIGLNINLLYWYFQQNQCLNIKKQAVHNIHILSWGPILVGSRATAQHAHALRRHWSWIFIFSDTSSFYV